MSAAPRPDVSIVIVAFNGRGEIERCLGSIAAHSGALRVQVVLCDNASYDGTVGWVEECHPEVGVIELSENIGVAARRVGLRHAKGRYIMFLDSDAALTEGALQAMVAVMDDHPDWALLGPRLVGDNGRQQPSMRRFPPWYLPFIRRPPLASLFEQSRPVQRYLMADADHGSPRPAFHVLGACQLFRAEHVNRALPFADWIFLGPDDIDWCIKLRDAGGEIVFWPEVTVIHSYRRRSKKNPISRAAWEHLKSFMRAQWRYRYRIREFRRLESELDRRAEGGWQPNE